ncbi:hypothetical protein CLOP_g5256 [Closterium sp. NIES-67]|nr:hypothetical protein CLOP_g5256 [Closterium sp. NIES-67]
MEWMLNGGEGQGEAMAPADARLQEELDPAVQQQLVALAERRRRKGVRKAKRLERQAQRMRRAGEGERGGAEKGEAGKKRRVDGEAQAEGGQANEGGNAGMEGVDRTSGGQRGVGQQCTEADGGRAEAGAASPAPLNLTPSLPPSQPPLPSSQPPLPSSQPPLPPSQPTPLSPQVPPPFHQLLPPSPQPRTPSSQPLDLHSQPPPSSSQHPPPLSQPGAPPAHPLSQAPTTESVPSTRVAPFAAAVDGGAETGARGLEGEARGEGGDGGGGEGGEGGYAGMGLGHEGERESEKKRDVERRGREREMARLRRRSVAGCSVAGRSVAGRSGGQRGRGRDEEWTVGGTKGDGWGGGAGTVAGQREEPVQGLHGEEGRGEGLWRDRPCERSHPCERPHPCECRHPCEPPSRSHPEREPSAVPGMRCGGASGGVWRASEGVRAPSVADAGSAGAAPSSHDNAQSHPVLNAASGSSGDAHASPAAAASVPVGRGVGSGASGGSGSRGRGSRGRGVGGRRRGGGRESVRCRYPREDISLGKEVLPIPWVNDVNDEQPPATWLYMKDSWNASDRLKYVRAVLVRID